MQVVQVYFVYMDRRNPSQEWGVNYANRNKLWHFLTAVIWGMWWFFGKEENYTFLLCFILYLRAISNFQFPISDFRFPIFRLISGGAILRRIFCVTNMGALYLEGLIFGILRYFPENFICKLTYNESENFSGSSLHHIFESENFWS